ncbi:hypothetical protein NQ314_010231 [Rhamnusium bicolor]|uniref:LisH domain-containing protein n=1 Tax=Rhamnusium bicolor TaxID=1586634 RepID=A0AAV8XTG6_9CUCU|nr:hypothetical protein NQ314_010231 [Rhamnusium bicolor]
MSNPLEFKQRCDIKSQTVNKHITYNDIACKLLQDKFLLTALELHTELVESGKELRLLKEFFSNPGNFELQTQESSAHLSRSGSQVTLDSLDLTRYSEDGAGVDEKVAVLEFELRKAKETINALRNNLTVATESVTSSPDKTSLRNINAGGIKPHEQRALNFLINEYLLLHGYKLTSITFADENQSQDFDDWDDVGLNISKPPELLALYREGLKQTRQNNWTVSTQTECIVKDDKKVCYNNLKLKEEIQLSSQLTVSNENDLTLAKKPTAEQRRHTDFIGSDSPERFEIIDKSMSIFKKTDTVSTLEDNISNSSFNTGDWLNLNIPLDNKDCDSYRENKSRDLLLDISKDAFVKEVFSLCYVKLPHKVDNEILDDILNQTVTNETFVHIVSSSLFRIIPNIILNKREEVIPLIISTVHLNPKVTERDKLLQQLFNLKKKPSESERIMILMGLVGVAKCSGESLVENEILPQCWLQLAHKHIERRLLVSEACIALMPYISNPIRNSLCLSMLQQMLEDKEKTVRETVVRALAILTSLCKDSDKYYQCEQLAMNTLNDSSNSVVNLSIQILFPVIGQWALNEGHDFKNMCTNLTNPETFFKSDVNCGMILYEFNKYVADNPNISWKDMDWIVDFCPSLHIIPVYLIVLTYSGDFEELSNILKKFLCALPLCGSPLDCLEITVRRLCESGLQEVVVDCLWNNWNV